MDTYLTTLAASMDELGRRISTIKWGDYSPLYKERDYQGLVVAYRKPGATNQYHFMWGNPPYSTTERQGLEQNFDTLSDFPAFRSSLEGSDPRTRLDSGAIRLPDRAKLGATQMPAIGCHVFLFTVALHMKLVVAGTWLHYVDTSNPSVRAILEADQISKDWYFELANDIDERVRTAIQVAT